MISRLASEKAELQKRVNEHWTTIRKPLWRGLAAGAIPAEEGETGEPESAMEKNICSLYIIRLFIVCM